MSHLVTITRQGQLTIPAALRRKYHLEKESQVILRDTETGIAIEPMPHIEDLMGVLKSSATVVLDDSSALFAKKGGV